LKKKRGDLMSQFALEVKSLTKRIGKKTIVDDVSFQVERGEIFGLLGPNGAGKTTIIRMIVSLINRTGGTVLVNGQDLDESFTQAMNELGAIVENPEFYKYLSGYKNLKHYARMALTDISEERIEEVTELVGLEKAIHDKVRTYSLGMRQRLGVAQAILHKPSILILDEPTNGLDPQGIREFRDYLRLLASQGTSVLVSSHLLSEMQLMCDRFAIIEQGKLIHISTMNESEAEETKVLRIVELEVSDASLAAKLLSEKMPEVKVTNIKESGLILSVEKETIPEINKLLVLNDIDVFEILNVKATLEDRFLEITNKDKKEQMV
jgi:ABC-2 type transport system ATP-binding protein